MENNSYSLSLMDQSTWQEEIKYSENHVMQNHPARGEVRNDVLQGESDGPQISDNKRVTQKREIISGVFLGIIFIVITFNLDLNSICQKEGSFLQGSGQVFPSSHSIERKASK